MQGLPRKWTWTLLGSTVAAVVYLAEGALDTPTAPAGLGTAPEALAPRKLSPQEKARVAASLGRLPLLFVENGGQLDERVAYVVQGKGTSLYFTAEGGDIRA